MGIFGIGTDIVEIGRIKKAAQNRRFLEVCFTPAEIEFCEGKGAFAHRSFAGYFAAKEAVAKALGVGFRGFKPKVIEFFNDDLGKPYARYSKKVKEAAKLPENGAIKVFISISHEKDYAIAMAVIEIESP